MVPLFIEGPETCIAGVAYYRKKIFFIDFLSEKFYIIVLSNKAQMAEFILKKFSLVPA